MEPEEQAQAWLMAYALSFAITALGGEISRTRNSPADIDQRARYLADMAAKTIVDKAKEFEKQRKKS